MLGPRAPEHTRGLLRLCSSLSQQAVAGRRPEGARRSCHEPRLRPGQRRSGYALATALRRGPGAREPTAPRCNLMNPKFFS